MLKNPTLKATPALPVKSVCLLYQEQVLHQETLRQLEIFWKEKFNLLRNCGQENATKVESVFSYAVDTKKSISLNAEVLIVTGCGHVINKRTYNLISKALEKGIPVFYPRYSDLAESILVFDKSGFPRYHMMRKLAYFYQLKSLSEVRVFSTTFCNEDFYGIIPQMYSSMCN